MNKITAHFISIYFALSKETRILKKNKKKQHIYRYVRQFSSTSLSHSLKQIFQYIFRLLYDYGAEASQCPTTSTV